MQTLGKTVQLWPSTDTDAVSNLGVGPDHYTVTGFKVITDRNISTNFAERPNNGIVPNPGFIAIIFVFKPKNYMILNLTILPDSRIKIYHSPLGHFDILDPFKKTFLIFFSAKRKNK